MTAEDAAWAAEEALVSVDVRRDARALDALLAADFHEIGASGRHWSRAELIAALLADPMPGAESAELSERRCDELGDGRLLLSYRVRDVRRSSLWDLQGGAPRLLFHQGTRVASDAGA